MVLERRHFTGGCYPCNPLFFLFYLIVLQRGNLQKGLGNQRPSATVDTQYQQALWVVTCGLFQVKNILPGKSKILCRFLVSHNTERTGWVSMPHVMLFVCVCVCVARAGCCQWSLPSRLPLTIFSLRNPKGNSIKYFSVSTTSQIVVPNACLACFRVSDDFDVRCILV